MWHYNFDYLSHGMNGYKYIDKYRGKNGKWNYVYEGQRARERGIKRSTIATKQNVVNQLGFWDKYQYLESGRVPEDSKYKNNNKKPARKMNLTKQEIRQKVDPAIDQKAREREIAKGKAAAKDYRQSKVTAAEVQRERERAIKEGMSSNRQWNRDAISKGSSVEAAQKARERNIAEGKASAKQYSTSVGAKKNAELAKILGNMINETKNDIKKNVHANFKTNEAQRGRAEDINKSVEAAREAQRKKENSLGARIKRNIDDDIATAIASNNSKAKSPKEIIKSNAKDIVEGKVNSMSREERAAKQQEREHSRTTAAIDAQNARQRAIEASQARQRQAAAAKQQEEERKKAGNRSVERAQNAREAAIAKSVQTTKETNQAKQVANAAKQAERERRQASNSAERAQNARQKGMDESVRKTWEQKAKAEIKNKAQFDRKQDELKQVCNNLKKQYFAQDESKNLLGGKNWNKINQQRQFAINNWGSKIKNIASLLAASDVSAMDNETYEALRTALYTIRSHQDAYNQGSIESKNNNDVRNQLYYKKDETKDLVREIEDILEEVKLNEDYLYEDVTREKLLREKKIK